MSNYESVKYEIDKTKKNCEDLVPSECVEQSALMLARIADALTVIAYELNKQNKG